MRTLAITLFSILFLFALIPVTASTGNGELAPSRPFMTLAGDWDDPDNDDDEEEDDDYRWKTWRTHRSHGGFSGFGGFYYNMQTFETEDIDALAAEMGLDDFNSRIFGWGGYGMGHVGDGWRIGGGGHGAYAISDGVYTASDGDKYNRTLEMDLGMGGFMFEYSPWMIGPVNFGVGAMLGGGGVSIVMSQDTGTYTWSDLINQYAGDPVDGENIRTEVHSGFLVAEPYVTMRVHLLDWMALMASGGWTLTSLQSDEWMFNERELIGDGPDLDLNRPFVRVGLVFGG